jgi:hypothetical protein
MKKVLAIHSPLKTIKNGGYYENFKICIDRSIGRLHDD